MRLDKPIGIWLLMWPCWWSLALASNGLPQPYMLALFALGALVMRSAGCIVNDLADRKIDIKVERTKTRPLASGAITPYQAVACIGFLLAIALLIALQLHPNLLFWAIGSLGFVVAYPFMKRITWWPQAFLGFTFNIGALFGWIAIHGEPASVVWLLYIAGIFWTIGYDTIYAHQDIEDDLRIGVKSTAIRFGKHSRLAIGICYGLMLLALVGVGLIAQLNWYYYAGLGLIGTHLLWQVLTADLQNPASCLTRFKSNQWLGLILFATISISY